MRSALVIVTAILALNLTNGFVLAQIVDEWRWLGSLHMFDAQTGWALSTEGGSGAFSKGAVGSVVRTTDGGVHWKDVTPHTPPGQRFPQGVGDIHPLTHLNAWVLAGLVPLTWDGSQKQNPVVFHTVDGGQTWRSVLPASIPGSFMDFINSSDGWALSGKLLQNPTRWDELWDVHRSTDGGKSWKRVGSAKVGSAKIPGLPSFIGFLNTTTGWIGGTARDGNYARAVLLMTHDGGQTWQQQKLVLPSNLTHPGSGLIPGSPKFLTAQDGILSAFYSGYGDAGGIFYVTHDGGMTWTNTTPIALTGFPTDGGAGVGLPPDYLWWSFADVNHGWATFGDALYVTSDGGQRWTKIQPSLPEHPLAEIDFISPQVGWATGRAMQKPFLLKTIDGGRTWASVPYFIVK